MAGPGEGVVTRILETQLRISGTMNQLVRLARRAQADIRKHGRCAESAWSDFSAIRNEATALVDDAIRLEELMTLAHALVEQPKPRRKGKR